MKNQTFYFDCETHTLVSENELRKNFAEQLLENPFDYDYLSFNDYLSNCQTRFNGTLMSVDNCEDIDFSNQRGLYYYESNRTVHRFPVEIYLVLNDAGIELTKIEGVVI